MDEQLQVDWLDAKLRDEASYIDDAGFTARVVQQLPARRRSSRSLRAAILLGVTLFACVMAYVLSGRGAFLENAAEFLVAMPFVTVCALALCCGLVVLMVGTSAAVFKSREQRS